MLVRCYFAGYRRSWVTVVVTLVVVSWICGIVAVLITIFLIWRLAKKENRTGGSRAALT